MRSLVLVLCTMLVPSAWSQTTINGSPYVPGARPVFLSLPAADLRPGITPAGAQIPLWTGKFVYGGATYDYTMVGTDPALGSATSGIPLVIIPLAFVFPDGTSLSTMETACGDTSDALTRVVNSPLIAKTYRFTPGGTNVGRTQYIDAFQRANFWTAVQASSPHYHVLFSPVTVAPLQTIQVVRIDGKTVAGPCAPIGEVEFGFFDSVVPSLLKKLSIHAGQLPVFLSYNTFLTAGGCCIEGYHAALSSGQTYAMAVYSDPGIFAQPIEDIHALSHELGEWLDDPFSTNLVPVWGHVGQVSGCQDNLEVGDPVTGHAFTARLNGFTYHPEDLVFLPWFARASSSTSVNGWFTFLNGFAKPQAKCH